MPAMPHLRTLIALLPILLIAVTAPLRSASYIEQQIKKEAPQLPEAPRVVRVPIFVYHLVRPYETRDTRFLRQYLVTPEQFDQQMQYLVDAGYTAISFTQLAEYLNASTTLPQKPVIVSFDDGWENQYTYALPILRKHGITATFFVYSNAIGTQNHFTWDQLREMQGEGMHIGGHSRSHPFLAKITDPQKLTDEISGSKAFIDQELGTTTDTFAYPFGSYSAEVIGAVRAAGYSSARIFSSAETGELHDVRDLYTLSAIPAPESLEAFERYAPK